MGYPIKDVNHEALVEKFTLRNIAKIKEEHPDYSPTEAAYDEINNNARHQIAMDVKWNYSYQKYYKTRKKITQGKMSYSEWLDSHFMQKDNDDVAFLKAYGAGTHGELFEGFNIALTKHFGDTLCFTFIGDPLEISSKGKTYFWTYTFPACPFKDTTTLMVFCFEYDTTYRRWESYKYVYPKYAANKEEVNTIKILKHSSGEDEYDNITTDYIVFTNDSGKYFLGNNTIYNSNFIKIENVFSLAGNYKVVMKGLNLNKDKLVYADLISNDGETEVAALKNIPADKRIYQSTLQFEDLKGDGGNEAYLVSVSNGKIIQSKVYITTDKGVKEVPIDETWNTRIR